MNAKEKQDYERWCELIDAIIAATYIDEDEPEEVTDDRRQQLEADPEEWFKYYFPNFAYAPPADFHKAATRRVLENSEWCEVRMWSRELAKSTRTMMEVFYLTLVGHAPEATGGNRIRLHPTLRHRKRYVLMVSNSLDNATRLLMPYRANLEYNRRIIQDYGIQESAGPWQAAEFVTGQGVAFRAIGIGQSPRGARNEEVRPDIILFDDVDTDADCLNPEIIAKKWRWIEEAAIGTRSVSEPTTIIFCGNRIAVSCCITNALTIADHTEQINIRDDTGRSVWPQKNSETDINRVLSQKSYTAQQKEYFNNPITEGAVFKAMAYKPARPLREYELLVCYTDPSYKDTNDYKATVLVGRWKGEYHIIKCFVELATTARMIEWLYQVYELTAGYSCYFFMESGFMQDVLRKEVYDAGTLRGRTIPMSADSRAKPNKFMRIESLLEPLHRNGKLYLNDDQRHDPGMERLAGQFVAFAAGSSAHDDGPDAVEGAVWIMEHRMSASSRTGIIGFTRTETKNHY